MRYAALFVFASLLACQPVQSGIGTPESSEGSGTSEPESTSASEGPTSQGTADGTGTGSSGGSAGSSGGSGTESAGSSGTRGESGSESSGGGMPNPGVGEPYGPCDDMGQCLDDNECYQYQRFDMCLAPCGPGPVFECPDSPGGTAYPECIGAVGVLCMLNCQDGGTCPEGTTCEEVFTDIFRCLWP
ncbi:hypothetical protein [Paraliomyxa miuraensis]|uniref:hypothetical protein n=1 Tax=Paraliomyxa miuraensis TaxID=376150 RepID=UPI002252D506|nr:hypothetical protein [Paraliomyxa miuraensis]MCX4240935.1 hypothetical protein [Paraliomyxa miuraensis]